MNSLIRWCINKTCLIFFVVIAFPLFIKAQHQECFLLMAGKNATVDGKILLAHNNDLSGTEASMLVKISAEEKINNLPDLSYPSTRKYEMLILQTNLGFAEGDAVAVNEHGVAIAGGLSLKRDRNERVMKADPLTDNGLGGGVRYLALQHSRTARQFVKLIGELYNQYGIGYPSGVGVADTNEVWYMETGGGKSWAAVLVPDSTYIVAANSYRIQEIDFGDSINFITSPNLKSFCSENELLTQEKKVNFASVFGGGVKEKEGNNYYNTLRVWRAIDLLSPEVFVSDEDEVFPMFIKPLKKINIQTCFIVLRDYYKGTPYDIFLEENVPDPERSIAVWRCVHTNVISLDPGVPVNFGAVLWTGLSSPFTAVYIPMYYGISEIPSSYNFAPKEYDENSAFWIFKKPGDLSREKYPELMSDWIKERENFEIKAIIEQESIMSKAEMMLNSDPKKLPDYLNSQCEKYAIESIEMATKMSLKLHKE